MGIIIPDQRQLVAINCTPDAGVVSCLFGSDSHAICKRDPIQSHHVSDMNKDERAQGNSRTLPSDSLRMNLYWNVVLGGKYTVAPHTG